MKARQRAQLLARQLVEALAVIERGGDGLIESTNTKLRLLTRLAYRFRSTTNLIALCMVDRGGHCPPLPGRT